MVSYIIRRLIQSIPTLLGISILSFGLMTAIPGGPLAALAYSPKITPAARAKLAEQLGVNDPIPVQYLRWLSNIMRGNLGNSFSAKRPVADLIAERLPATLELGGLALLFGTVIGIPIGVIAAVKRGSWFDNITRVLAVITTSVPTFWLGLILILIFGSWLKVLPMGGRFPATLNDEVSLGDRIRYLILPVFILAMGNVAILSRYTRAAVLEVSRQDYIRTAQAKGLRSYNVWFGHAVRNAMIPLATFLGPALIGIVNGALITERIFSWPGLGRLTVDAVGQFDYPVVMATVLLGAVATILGYLLSDIMYAWVDPRIRYS